MHIIFFVRIQIREKGRLSVQEMVWALYIVYLFVDQYYLIELHLAN